MRGDFSVRFDLESLEVWYIHSYEFHVDYQLVVQLIQIFHYCNLLMWSCSFHGKIYQKSFQNCTLHLDKKKTQLFC